MEELIEDYKNWVEQALEGRTDNVGIVNISVENFRIKLTNFVKEIQNESKKEEKS